MTLLQQPAKTRPTAKSGRMAGAGLKGSERADAAPAYTASPGSRAATSAAAQNIATVPERCSSPGPPPPPLPRRPPPTQPAEEL